MRSLPDVVSQVPGPLFRYKFKPGAKHETSTTCSVYQYHSGTCLRACDPLVVFSLRLVNFSLATAHALPETMSSLVKIPLIIVAAFGAWYALTPPQPPPGAQERVKSGGVERSFGSVVRIHAFVWKVCPSSPRPLHSNSSALPFPVVCHHEPRRRARRLCVPRVLLAPPLPPIPLHSPPCT
jgi:hypothetical protein